MSIVSRLLLKSEADTGGVSRMSGALRDFRRDASNTLSGFGRESERTLSGFNRAVLGIRTGLLQTAGGFILGELIQDATRSIIDFGKSFIQVGSDVQQFKLQFTNLFKTIGLSAEEAGEQAENAFAFAKEVAKTTQFDLPEITQAILRLETFGLSVDENLGRAIDLSAALGANLEEVVRAFTNLQSRRFGEAFEQFARFGIARDLLEGKGLVFDRNGSYQGSVNQAMDAIREIIDEKFQGFSESQQGTFKQLQSNLGDIIFQFKEAFGGPIFEGVNQDLKEFVQTLSDNQSTIEGFGFAFGELFESARTTFADSLRSIISDLQGGGGVGPDDFLEFGTNLMVAFGEGILEGAKFVLEAAVTVAEGIAFFFESFSPPKGGPLREIDVWGANLMNTFLEGFGNANFSLLTDVLDLVKDQFDSLVDAGFIDTETPKQDFLDLVDTILTGFDDIANGGEGAIAVFEQLSTVIGDSAFAIQELIALSSEIATLGAELDSALGALDDFDEAWSDEEQAIQDQIDALERADRERREAFEAAQDAADAAADTQQPSAGGGNAAQDAADASKQAIEDQIDALQDQKEAIEDQADAAVDLVEAQRDADLALLEAAERALDDQSTAAERALQDFNFQTEGIPERFTRQRRRELERIATLRKREAEDGKKAIRDEEDLIKRNAKLRIDSIREEAKLRKRALDDEIDALRDRVKEIGRAETFERRVNAERRKRPKFVPDPRIQELKDQLEDLKKVRREERETLQDRIDAIREELEAKKAAYDEIKGKLDAQLEVLGLIAEAQKEQIRLAQETAAETAKIKLPEPTDREISLFTKPIEDFKAKIEEAKAKLRELIPQDVRDDLKRDIEFFAEFFKGLAGIESSTAGDGFTQGQDMREALKRIGTAFRTEVLPVIIEMKNAFFSIVEFANDLADFVDRIKEPAAGALSALLEFAGLRNVPVIKQIVDFLEKPVRSELANFGALLLFLWLTPGLTFNMLFNFSVRLLGLAAQLIPVLFGIGGTGGRAGALGRGGLLAARGLGLAGAGGLGAVGAVPILIAIAVILSIALILALATDFKGLRSKIIDFVKNNPVVASLLTLVPVVGLVIHLSILFEFLTNPADNTATALKKIKEFISPIAEAMQGLVGTVLGFGGNIGKTIGDFFNGIGTALSGLGSGPPGGGATITFLRELPDLIGKAGSAITGAGSGVISGIGNLAKAIGAPFVGALRQGTQFMGPWARALGEIVKIPINIFALPFKVFVDFLDTVAIPLFQSAAPLALDALSGAIDKLGDIVGPAFNRVEGAVRTGVGSIVRAAENIGTDIKNIFSSAFGGLSEIVGPPLSATFSFIAEMIGGFIGNLSSILSPILGIFSSTFGQIGPLLGGIFSGLLGIVGPPLMSTIQGILNIVSSLGGGITGIISSVIVPAVNGIVGVFQGIAGPIGTALSGLSGIISGAFQGAMNFITGSFIPFFSTTLPNAISGFASFINTVLTSQLITNPFETAKNWLSTDFGPFITTTVPSFFSSMKTMLTTIFGTGFDFLVKPFESLVDFFDNSFIPLVTNRIPSALSGLVSSVTSSLSGLGSGIINGISPGINYVLSIPSKISNGLGDGTRILYSFGRGIVQGLINGIVSLGQQLVDVIDKWIVGPLSKVGDVFKFGSPSKVTTEWGRGIVDGLIVGIGNRQSGLSSSVNQIVDILSQANGNIGIIDGEETGKISGRQFISAFLGEVDTALARNPSLGAFFEANINQISVKVDNHREKEIKATTATEAANVIAKILKQSA